MSAVVSIPLVTLPKLLCLTLGCPLEPDAVALLQFPGKLLAMAFQLSETVVRQLAPPLFYLAFDLMPDTAHTISIHAELLME
jgi:hypothetical protein